MPQKSHVYDNQCQGKTYLHKMDIHSIKLSDECLSNISNSFLNISLIVIFSTHSNLFKWHQHLGHINIGIRSKLCIMSNNWLIVLILVTIMILFFTRVAPKERLFMQFLQLMKNYSKITS
jgi:hypothetical protein